MFRVYEFLEFLNSNVESGYSFVRILFTIGNTKGVRFYTLKDKYDSDNEKILDLLGNCYVVKVNDSFSDNTIYVSVRG